MPEEPKRITFTREELYEKLWQIPTKHLANELGMSDVMLGKLCKECTSSAKVAVLRGRC